MHFQLHQPHLGDRYNAGIANYLLALNLDLKPTNNLLFLRYADRPGVVGVVGNALGKLKINIADMQVGRTQEGGQALMALTVDSVIPKEIIDVIAKETGASLVRFVNLVNE